MTRAERRVPGSRDYGEKFNYDPQWKGPLEVERKRTDFGFLVALCIYLAVWIGNGIYAFHNGDVRAIYKDFHLDYFFLNYTDVIYIALGISILGFCLGFTYLLLLKYYPKTVVIASFFVNIIVLLIICIVVIQVAIPEIPQYMKNYIIAAIVIFMLIIFAITVLCLVAIYKQILIACEVIKESSKVVMFFPLSFWFPILEFIWYLLVTAFTTCTWACLYENSSTQNGDTPYHLYLLHGINFFGFLWVMTFVYAFSQMVLSGTFATWYWTMDRDRISSYTILRFMYITARFHFGTLAFGSLIIAMIREEFMECINANAYIMCIMHGTNFIQSAKDAFNLIQRNILKFWAVSWATNAVIIMGLGVVIFFSVLATYAYCQNMNIIVMYSAMGTVFVTTILISATIFGVLETAVDTIFLCVLEDDERNNGSRERPYFMTPEMRRLLMQATEWKGNVV